jgi:hypothetical protein
MARAAVAAAGRPIFAPFAMGGFHSSAPWGIES